MSNNEVVVSLSLQIIRLKLKYILCDIVYTYAEAESEYQ